MYDRDCGLDFADTQDYRVEARLDDTGNLSRLTEAPRRSCSNVFSELSSRTHWQRMALVGRLYSLMWIKSNIEDKSAKPHSSARVDDGLRNDVKVDIFHITEEVKCAQLITETYNCRTRRGM